MLLKLPEELRDKVLAQLKPVANVGPDRPLKAEREVRENQDALQVLMRSCKSLKEVSTSLLYKDCLVRNVAAFFRTAASRPSSFRSVERITAYHDLSSGEPGYLELLYEGRWFQLHPKDRPDALKCCIPETAIVHGLADTSEGAIHIIRACTENPTLIAQVLPKLVSVSFGGLGEHLWNQQQLTAFVQLSALGPQGRRAAHTLLDIPSVRHVCQSLVLGPLSLSGVIIYPNHPVKVFSYHPRPFLYHCPHSPEQPPIIVGAVNRFYYPCFEVIPSDSLRATSELMMSHVLSPLFAMLGETRTEVMITKLGNGPMQSKILPDVEYNTTIEIYDFIRVIHPISKKMPTDKMKTLKYATRPAKSLQAFQDLLDKGVHPAWKGKVFLRNREDAPPCSACGFKVMDEWNGKEGIRKHEKVEHCGGH